MNLKIEVTERDVEQGVPCTVSRCPVALAVKRAVRGMKGIKFVSAATHQIIFSYKKKIDKKSTIKTPKTAREFMNEFDIGTDRKMFPFFFSIKLPGNWFPKAKKK